MSRIQLQNVSKRFGDALAVDRVSLDIKEGELFFLLGPSGCGKTTVLRMIAGFCSPDDGDILMDGQSVKRIAPRKRNTALVFQNYALWPHMSVGRNVSYGLEERGIPREERKRLTEAALKSVRMESYIDRKPAQLSGGQQQRVALARALVVKPGAVLLDEPLSNLDARLREEMRREIRRIHDETGVTMVYVTHDQKEALTMADRVAVMSMGRVEQVGSPRSLYFSPANHFVASFLGDANFISGTMRETGKDKAAVDTAIGVITITAKSPMPAPGAAVECAIRPEHVRMDAPGGTAMTIEQCLHYGEVEEYTLRRGDIILRAVTLSGPVPRKAGSEITVSWDPEHVLLFPKGETRNQP